MEICVSYDAPVRDSKFGRLYRDAARSPTVRGEHITAREPVEDRHRARAHRANALAFELPRSANVQAGEPDSDPAARITTVRSVSAAPSGRLFGMRW